MTRRIFEKQQLLLAVCLLTAIFMIPFAEAAEKGGAIIEAIQTEPTNLNTLKAARRPEMTVLHLMFEPLFTVNKKLEIEPLLVDSYKVSADGLTWTLKMKPGINFHDGSPLNAEAVKFSLEKIQTGTQGIRISAIKEIKIVDSMTIDILLKQPYPVFLTALSNPNVMIFSKVAYEKNPQDWGSKVLSGTGPLMFMEWKSGDRVIMKRNPAYKHGPSFVTNKGPAHADEWIIRFIPEQATLIGELTSGEVDLSDYVSERDIDRIKNSKDADVIVDKSTVAVYININCSSENKPFNDPKMRSALCHSVNTEAVRRAALNNVADPLYTYISPQTMGFSEASVAIAKPLVEYAPDKAKAILEELGWKDAGKGYREKDGAPLEVEFLAFNMPMFKRIAEVTAPMLEKAGFKVNLKILEAGDLYERVLKGNHDLLATSLVVSSGVALDDLVATLHSKNIGTIMQWAHYKNPEMDKLLDTALYEIDDAKRKSALLKVQELAAREVVCIPIANAKEIFGYKKTIGGVENYKTHPWAYNQADMTRALELFKKK
jgi:peptide/nickel transport system substrate-binding protein